jgi:dTDP-4-dehydrorhamnose 3,5-epimerase
MKQKPARIVATEASVADPAADWMARGIQDQQTVTADWLPVGSPAIEGVIVKEIRAIPTSTGALTEVWRSEWQLDALPVDQVFQRSIEPGGVTGWHAHAFTTDRLFCAAGRVRLSLYDGRRSSRSYGNLWHRVFGLERPVLVVVPPGVWHGVAGLGSSPALIINLVDRAYSYESPDHWRLPPDTPLIPYSLIDPGGGSS